MTENSTITIRCDVCGEPRPHFSLGGNLEKDTNGRVFKRMKCGTCSAHTRVYDEPDHSQTDEQTP